MKEEIINSNFDINEKYDDMIDTAKFIVECYTLINDDGSEPPSHICLAYDVKNYLPKLLEENKSLQSQLKAKKEVIKEAREYIKEHTDLEPYNEDGEGGGLILCDYDVANVLEILSKGENK